MAHPPRAMTSPAPVIALVGSFDTKGDEYAFIEGLLRDAGVQTITIDTGILGVPTFVADVSRDDVAREAGTTIAAARASGDRASAQAIMTRGGAAVLADLYVRGSVQGALALGGTGGTSLASGVFRVLPIGVPKLIVSTAASGDTSAYVGDSDLVLAPSVVDIAGLNRISRPILANAAAAIAGMVGAPPPASPPERPLIAASMFGVTTPGVTRAKERLDALGYEVVVFHMTGAGGRSMERLIRDGFFAGVLDLTTTELADELVGGVFSAGPDRLTAAGLRGVPQVVSVGALDMVNFGPRDTVPAVFADRLLHVHNTAVTLMRTTATENAALGRILAERVSRAGETARVLLPLGGVSALDVEGQPFHDREADEALFAEIRAGLSRASTPLATLDHDINHPAFAEGAANLLHDAILARAASERN